MKKLHANSLRSGCKPGNKTQNDLGICWIFSMLRRKKDLSHEPTLWPDAGDTRVGGRSAKNPEDRKLVTPVLLGDERDRFFANVGLPGDNLLQSLDQTGQEAVLSKLADSTRRSYGAGWKQWSTFMSGTGVSPFLQGESRAEKQADEEWLIRFVVFLHQHMGRTAQGIKTAPFRNPLCPYCCRIPRPSCRKSSSLGRTGRHASVGWRARAESSCDPPDARLAARLPARVEPPG